MWNETDEGLFGSEREGERVRGSLRLVRVAARNCEGLGGRRKLKSGGRSLNLRPRFRVLAVAAVVSLQCFCGRELQDVQCIHQPTAKGSERVSASAVVKGSNWRGAWRTGHTWEIPATPPLRRRLLSITFSASIGVFVMP